MAPFLNQSNESDSLLSTPSHNKTHTKSSWTSQEYIFQSLWAIVLGLSAQDIRRDENFFRLGGDSIAAMKLCGSARAKQLLLSVQDIMSNPVLYDMAAVAKHDSTQSTDETIEPFSMIAENNLQAIKREAALGCGFSEDLIEDIYPCTALQEGLLSLSGKMGTNHGACIIREVLDIEPNADVTRLIAAWATVFYCNPELRTRIVDTRIGGLVQVVVRHQLDFASRDSLEACDSYAEDTDFRAGSPFVRLRLINNPSKKQRHFVLISHHSMMDGWIARLIAEQVEQAYRGQTIPDTKRFTTFVKYINQLDKTKQQSYWQAMLDDSSVASFPTVPSGLDTRWSNRCKKHHTPFNAQNIQGKALDYTMTTYIRQAWALVCSAYTGSNDVVFGVSLNGRNAPVPGMEKVFGTTVAAVPLRVRLDYGASVDQSLRGLQEQGINMIPFEQTGLQNIRKMGMGPATAANFQSLLVIQPPNANEEGFALSRAESTDEGFVAQSNYPLVVECALLQNGAGVRVRVGYNDQVLGDEQVDRIMKQVEYVLLQLLSQNQENRLLRDVEVITPGEIEQLQYWNGHLAPALEYCVHDVIQGRLASIADAQAVYAWDQTLTARELDDVTTQLAGYLRSLQIGPEATIPVFFERSSLTIITMLAVLKSGNACVTLDKRQPPSRLQKIIQKVGARFVLISENHQGLLETPDVTQIVVTRETLKQMPRPEGRIITGVTPDSPAFLMFTSGSTGEPKGIVHNHRSMCNIIIAHGVGCNIKQGSRVLQFASPSFDTSVWEIMMTLVLGGCICVPSDYERMNDPGGFANRAQVDLTLSSPTAIRSMAPEDVPSMKTVILVGEAIPRDVVEAWSPTATVMNGYGPAECGGCSTLAIDETRWPMATLGHTRGCVYWLTDPVDPTRLAPIGAVGEILIEGPIIAHGYLNDPEKTSASFLTDMPWLNSFRPGSRLYRSGDLGTYNPDGTVVYLGRRDMQIKLRGQRVELGEVESHLRRFLPGTNLAADVIRFGETDHLTAFIAQGDGDLNAPLELLPHNYRLQNSAEISSHLGAALPPYMVPSVYLPVSRIPTTTSSKTDRKILRSMVSGLSKEDIAGYHSTELMEEPSTPNELELRDVWADLLHIGSASIKAKSHFFHIGGDSVEAMKLVSMARRQGRDLNFAQVYQNPQLCDMAQHWATKGTVKELEKEWPPFTLLEKPDNEEFLATQVCEPFAVPRDDIKDAYPAHDNQYFTFKTEERLYAHFDIPASVDVDRAIEAWMMVVRQHDILRTIICPDPPSMVVVVRNSLTWDVERYTTDESGMKEMVQKDMQAGLQYGSALGKVIVVENAEKQTTTLILKLSHCIYDGFCLDIYWKDWQSAYESGNVPSRLNFQDVLSSWKFAEGRDESLRYWQNLLRDANLLDLPIADADQCSDEGPRFVERKLDGIVAPPGLILDSLIKAAWTVTMATMTGQSDIVFFQIISGRRLGGEKIENATGPLMGVFPVRVMLNSDTELRADELCRFLQGQDTDGIAHEMIDPDEIWKIRGWDEEDPFTLVDHVKADMDSQLTLDGASCALDSLTTGGAEPLTMCMVKTMGHEAHVSLSRREGLSYATAEKATDLFCEKLRAFSQDPTMRVR